MVPWPTPARNRLTSATPVENEWPVIHRNGIVASKASSAPLAASTRQPRRSVRKPMHANEAIMPTPVAASSAPACAVDSPQPAMRYRGTANCRPYSMPLAKNCVTAGTAKLRCANIVTSINADSPCRFEYHTKPASKAAPATSSAWPDVWAALWKP